LKKILSFFGERPHFWFQLYWPFYLVWFFALDRSVVPKYIIRCPLDAAVPFCEWFVFPYCSWFALLVFTMMFLWRRDTAAYDRLCLMMFSGMTLCLVLYMIFPNGLALRPDPASLGRDNAAMRLLEKIWSADSAANVCPSIHCQSTAAMALAFSRGNDASRRPRVRILVWAWAALICASTLFTKQHSVIDVLCGLALTAPWYFILYFRRKKMGKHFGEETA
jgi:membrane-associated phospholipid phosphatase